MSISTAESSTVQDYTCGLVAGRWTHNNRIFEESTGAKQFLVFTDNKFDSPLMGACTSIIAAEKLLAILDM